MAIAGDKELEKEVLKKIGVKKILEEYGLLVYKKTPQATCPEATWQTPMHMMEIYKSEEGGKPEWKCTRCGKGGDAVDFEMWRGKYKTRREAVKAIAERHKITVGEANDGLGIR